MNRKKQLNKKTVRTERIQT